MNCASRAVNDHDPLQVDQSNSESGLVRLNTSRPHTTVRE